MWPALGSARDGTPPPTQPSKQPAAAQRNRRAICPLAALPPDQIAGVWGRAPGKARNATRPPASRDASGQPKRSRSFRIRVSEELGAPVPLLVLPDLPSGKRQRRQRPQKPLVRPVTPRHGPKSLPPRPPQLVKPTVVPGTGVGISGNGIPGVQSALGQQRPRLGEVRISPDDLAGISTAISGSLRLRTFGKTSRLGPEEVLNHAPHRAPSPEPGWTNTLRRTSSSRWPQRPAAAR
ncbi:hypothetical protein DFR72_105171 [Lentzea flaviverrucosa]|uniref:Uncharacterized protein n=1 Tax=Lentzea flaviverrucosa TaxID=200379 RepID=A0A1H9PS20_9PSEU|nr:hypothetical protein DFR72_105171 [Lentzea flaviverrucosa]SER51014.1 hypothetical protein SAMN05216195_105401 [Lentzea flaviverrucosa]